MSIKWYRMSNLKLTEESHFLARVLFKKYFHYTAILTVITTKLQLATLGHCVSTLKQYRCEHLLRTSNTLQFSMSLTVTHKFCGRRTRCYEPHSSALLTTPHFCAGHCPHRLVSPVHHFTLSLELRTLQYTSSYSGRVRISVNATGCTIQVRTCPHTHSLCLRDSSTQFRRWFIWKHWQGIMNCATQNKMTNINISTMV
jgi:hypothetical protein